MEPSDKKTISKQRKREKYSVDLQNGDDSDNREDEGEGSADNEDKGDSNVEPAEDVDVDDENENENENENEYDGSDADEYGKYKSRNNLKRNGAAASIALQEEQLGVSSYEDLRKRLQVQPSHCSSSKLHLMHNFHAD